MASSSTKSSSDVFASWAEKKRAEAAEKKQRSRTKIFNESEQPFNFCHIAEVLDDREFAEYVLGKAARGEEIVAPENAVEALAMRGHLEAMKAVFEVYPPAEWSMLFRQGTYPSALRFAGSYGHLELFDYLVGLLADARTSSPETQAALDKHCWEPAPVPGRWLADIGMAFLVGPSPHATKNISAELHDRYLNFRLPWDPESGLPAPFEPSHLKSIKYRIGTAFVTDLKWRVGWEDTARLLREGPALPLDLLVGEFESMERSFEKNDPECFKYPLGTFQAVQVAVGKSLEALGPATPVDADLLVRAAAIVQTPEDDLPGARP